MLDSFTAHKAVNVIYNPATHRRGMQPGSTLEDKEEMVGRADFPKQPEDPVGPPPPRAGVLHQGVDTKTVRQTLYDQAQTKAPGTGRINFRGLRLLWKYNSVRVMVLIMQCVRLSFHLRAWKTVKGIMLRKPNKIDYILVKSYRVISLLNCLGKVYEEVAAEMIADWCKVQHIWHEG